MRVTIGLPTYHRPRGLGRALTRLAALESPEGVSLRLHVVDNDAGASGRVLFDDLAPRLPFPSHYSVEPARGVSHVRNRILDEAEARGEDAVAFLDDDEHPAAGWVRALVEVARVHAADLIGGPVTRVLPPGAPAWARQGDLFLTRRAPSGPTSLDVYMDNAFVGPRLLREWRLRFDPRLTLTGGEDRDFSRRARDLGARIAWADEARVWEEVAPSRLSVGWLVCRQLRDGSTAALSDARRLGWWRAAAGAVPFGASCMLAGLVRLALAARGPRERQVMALLRFAYGAGQWAGLAGLTYKAYRNPTPE